MKPEKRNITLSENTTKKTLENQKRNEDNTKKGNTRKNEKTTRTTEHTRIPPTPYPLSKKEQEHDQDKKGMTIIIRII